MKTAIVIQGSTICDNIEKLKNETKEINNS